MRSVTRAALVIATVLVLALACGSDPGATGGSSSSGDGSSSTATSSSGNDDESTRGSSSGSVSEASSSGGAETVVGETSTSDDVSSTGEGVTSTSSSISTTGTTEAPGVCGDGEVDAGEACDDANLDNSDACLDTCVAASCGDAQVQAGVELCDDGNLEAGDGCDELCSLEPWSHVGIAKNVPVEDLVGWEPCWSDTYEAGDLVSDLVEKCTGDHILFACRPLGDKYLTMAAHAPRDDVFFEPQVNYEAGERHEANGVSWGWAPYFGFIGFAPSGNTSGCYLEGQDEQMCWGVGGNLPLKFVAGRRCGEVHNLSVAETMTWERIAFHAW